MNTFGNRLRLTTFGESHGPAMGGVLDGVPSGMPLDHKLINSMLERRRTGTSHLVSARRESDTPEFLSGLSPDGLTLGSPLAFIVRNSDARSADYDELRHVYRPNHADYTYDVRYGLRDWRGGGRASARESVSRVIAGAIAKMILQETGVSVKAGVIAVGECPELPFLEAMARNAEWKFPESLPEDMKDEVEKARRQGDSVGAVVGCVVTGMPAGIGEPIYGKIQARLAEAMLSINAVKGFDYGSGFAAARDYGSRQADSFMPKKSTDASSVNVPPSLLTDTNHSGGLQGGITNGMPIYFRVAFKPTPSISSPLDTVDDQGRPVKLSVNGRHDPCVGLRGAVVVEAMAALVVADALLERYGSVPENRF